MPPRLIRLTRVASLAFLSLCAVRSALADPKVEETTLGEGGKWNACALSPKGLHVAVLVSKGSRFIVQIDGQDAGPRIDQLINLDGSSFFTGPSTLVVGANPMPVVFSDDGEHYAYLARAGDDFVVISDGKELARGKYSAGTMAYAHLTLTSGGKHVLFTQPASTNTYEVFVDGKPGPASHIVPTPVVSPDGNHYAYLGTQADGHDTKWAVVDGRQVKYFGDDLQFTAKGHLVAILHETGSAALNVDNKVVLRAAGINHLWVSPNGGQLAALITPQPDAKSLLTINGNPVPATEGANIANLYFSPDDKHWAALCMGGNNQFMIIDGKKEQGYDLISTSAGISIPTVSPRAWQTGHPTGTQFALESAASGCPGFTADSSKFVYIAQTGGKSFLVANEDESDPMPGGIAPLFSPDGKHIAYILNSGVTPGSKAKIVLDDKAITLNGRHGQNSASGDGMEFSPDGAHYALALGGVLYLDGKEIPGVTCPAAFLFSPDGHLIYQGSSIKDPTQSGLFIDDKFVFKSTPGVAFLRPTLSPDGKHIYSIGPRPPETSDDHDSGTVIADGKTLPVRFHANDANQPRNWQVAPDGSLSFVAITGEDLKRYKIIPDPTLSIPQLLSTATPIKQ